MPYGTGIQKQLGENIPELKEIGHSRYHYEGPNMPAHLFLHYLHRAKRSAYHHNDVTWLQSGLPKKLDGSLITAAQMVLNPPNSKLKFGWGVHIIEGPNHAVLSVMLAGGIAMPLMVSSLVVGVARTEEQGFGVGSYLLAIVSCIMVAIYFRLQDR